jgi:hypothetical protein
MVCESGVGLLSIKANAYKEKYDYMLKGNPENAYLLTGDKFKSNLCTVLKPSDSAPLRNYTIVKKDGVDSAYFPNTCYLEIVLDDTYYNETDKNFLVSVMFYDFGPGQGIFHVRYNTTGGAEKTIEVIKPGTKPGWLVKTIAINDIDLTQPYESGAHIRVSTRSSGYNAFKKVEIVNLDKAKRENKDVEISCLGTDADDKMLEYKFITGKDTQFADNKLASKTDKYDVETMIAKLSGKKSPIIDSSLKKDDITQGEMVKSFVELLGHTPEEDVIKQASMLGLVQPIDLVTKADAPATAYNLINVAKQALDCSKAEGGTLMEYLEGKGWFGTIVKEESKEEEDKKEEQKQEDTAAAGKYDYLFQKDKSVAYVVTGKKDDWETNLCSVVEPVEETDPTGYTLITVEGITTSYYPGNHYVDIKFDDSYYEPGDHTFLINVAMYTTGGGKFYAKYNNAKGEEVTAEMDKAIGKTGWFATSYVIDDIDLSKPYSSGTNLRISSRETGYNYFKKIEIINIDKMNREGKVPNSTCLGTTAEKPLATYGFASLDDPRWAKETIYKPASKYDVEEMTQRIGGNKTPNIPKEYENQTVTQGELLEAFIKMLGHTPAENLLAQATEIGLRQPVDLVLNPSSQASWYNLINISRQSLNAKRSNGRIQLAELIANDYFPASEAMILSEADGNFAKLYYAQPKKYPYKTIIDQDTGRTIHFLDFVGQKLVRPYMTHHNWSVDGKGFICGTLTTGGVNMYYYDIEKQTFYYIDLATNYGNGPNAVVTTDNRIIYVKTVNRETHVFSADLTDPTNPNIKDLFTAPPGGNMTGFSVSADGRYVASEYDPTEPWNPSKPYPEGAELGIRVDLETGEWIIFHHTWKAQNRLMHVQVNPVYPDLVFYSHDGTAVKYLAREDRMWLVDLSGEEHIHKDMFPIWTVFGAFANEPTHEAWSADGEWISAIDSSAFTQDGIFYLVDKEGRHRRIFKNPWGMDHKHGYMSSDARFYCADGTYVTVASLDTEQYFRIHRYKEDGEGRQVDHPYHAHPVVSNDKYYVNWGDRYNNVLGVYWYDFTEIVENEVAKGGRYPINETVDRISYEGLECETPETVKNGEECFYVKRGNSLYLDINNQNVIDTTNGAVTVTFDYFDNSKTPLTVTYTRGIFTKADLQWTDNGKITISRKGTNKWQQAKFTIDCGNFEDASKYRSDLRISGVSADTYIKNVVVERKDD